MSRRIVRRPEASRISGLSASTITRLEKENRWPARVQLTSNMVGWWEDEILAWLEERTRGMHAPSAPLQEGRSRKQAADVSA